MVWDAQARGKASKEPTRMDFRETPNIGVRMDAAPWAQTQRLLLPPQVWGRALPAPGPHLFPRPGKPQPGSPGGGQGRNILLFPLVTGPEHTPGPLGARCCESRARRAQAREEWVVRGAGPAPPGVSQDLI